MWRLFLLAVIACAQQDNKTETDTDGETSRKILGSSVVTSVSVIMDTGNGSKVYTDAVGRPVSKPQTGSDIASPIDLLNPDRYEFYTFDDSGDLIKRLMTLEEIREIVATGDGTGFHLDGFTSNEAFIPEKRFNDVVNNVQTVLKEEIENHKEISKDQLQLDTPDVSDSWSQILPAIFENSGEDISPKPTPTHATPDTIMVEPPAVVPPTTMKAPNVISTIEHISTTEKIMTLDTKKTKPTTTTTTTEPPVDINVEITTNSNSTTERNNSIAPSSSPVVVIKPLYDLELTKDNSRPIYHVQKTTKKPLNKPPTKRPTIKPTKVSTTTRAPMITYGDNVFSSSETATITTAKISQSTSPSTTKRSTTTKIPSTTTTAANSSPNSISTTIPANDYQRLTTFNNILLTTTPKLATTSNTPSPVPTTTSQDTLVNSEETTIFQRTEIAPTVTENPTTTNIPVINNLPTLLAILREGTKKPQETTTQVTTTDGGLSTFFIISDKRNHTEDSTKYIFVKLKDSTTTEENQYETSTVPYIGTTTTTMKPENPMTTTTTITTTEIKTEMPTTTEINTFPTWKFGDRIITTSKLPETTTQTEQTTYTDLTTLSSEHKNVNTNQIPNSSFIEINQSTDKNLPNLDQFLLTSTNIYEINSELSKTSPVTESEELSTISTEKTTKINEEITSTTTDRNFINSIEQLIAQAVGNTEEPVTDNEQIALKIHEVVANSGNKSMEKLQHETATFASNLINFETTTAIPTSTTETSTPPLNLLDESISSLLSQVWGTTIEPLKVETTTEQMSETTQHIINITIIRNENRTQPKPAKADTSLEIEYQKLAEELQKNLTIIPNESVKTESRFPELLKNETNISEVTTTLLPETTTSFESSTIENIATTNNEDTSTLTPTTTFIPEKSNMKPSMEITIKENNTASEEDSTTWTLVSTLAPPGESTTSSQPPETTPSPQAPVDLQHKPLQGFGLEDSTKNLDNDVYQFVQLCNELSFGFWKSVTSNISNGRSVIISPFAATSLLAMVFLGARGATSGEMNEILKLDDMVTFNPHLIFKNVSESIREDKGVAISAVVRELYSDRSKGKLLGFYKERVRQFYDGHVEEVSFKEIGDVIRRRTNLLVKKHTDNKIAEYLKDSFVNARPPLAGVSASIFQTECSAASTEGRDGEMYFVVLPSMRQRRLVPIPAAVWRSGFLAGYEPSIDATAAAIGMKDYTISTIFVMPGQQGVAAPGDGLNRLEKHLVESSFKKGAWSRLLRSLIPRPGVELQIPRFLHRSVINATNSFKKMGLHDLFDPSKADLRGLNGNVHELHLSDIIQINEFATCGDGSTTNVLHREIYPAAVGRRSRILEDLHEEPRDYQRSFHDPLHDPSYLDLPLPIRPRQARLPSVPRLRFDRPFLYFVRHNPSGLILHMGRFHPRLLP